MFWKKKKELIKEELDKFEKRFVVRTREGEITLYVIGKDIYCKGNMSKDPRYGLTYLKDLAIGEKLSYHNPRLDKTVNMGRIKSVHVQ